MKTTLTKAINEQQQKTFKFIIALKSFKVQTLLPLYICKINYIKTPLRTFNNYFVIQSSSLKVIINSFSETLASSTCGVNFKNIIFKFLLSSLYSK